LETVSNKLFNTKKMERLTLSSMMVATLGMDEMMNVRGGDGSTTPPPVIKPGIETDIIL
jgi:hypothetical protein